MLDDEYQSLLIVIPTRNRAQLAIGAIESVLSQNAGNVRVLVSDNSTIPEEVASLSLFCERLKDERLRYLATPTDLPMSPHWDWAIGQALQSDATHFTVLTDRMVFRPDELRPLIEHVKRHPTKVLSYKPDKVADHKRPVKLALQPWTGDLFEVRAERLLALTAECLMHECLPRMLNCVVPRFVLAAIETRFGTIFGSVAPDFNFCYKVLALEDDILFYDKAILVHRALDRRDRKSTRLNSSHANISYAVFCLKKKNRRNGLHTVEAVHPKETAADGPQLARLRNLPRCGVRAGRRHRDRGDLCRSKFRQRTPLS